MGRYLHSLFESGRRLPSSFSTGFFSLLFFRRFPLLGGHQLDLGLSCFALLGWAASLALRLVQASSCQGHGMFFVVQLIACDCYTTTTTTTTLFKQLFKAIKYSSSSSVATIRRSLPDMGLPKGAYNIYKTISIRPSRAYNIYEISIHLASGRPS